jgi:hypothetical protein
MGMFGFEDDEESAAQVAPKAKEQAGPAVENASLSAQYDRLAKDDSAVKQARSDADSRTKFLNIMQVIAGAGGNRSFDKVYDSERAKAAVGADQAAADHKEKLGHLLTKDKLSYQDVERKRAADKDAREGEEFGWKRNGNDPASKPSAAMRTLFAKQNGMDPAQLDGMSFEQLKDLQGLAKKASASGRTLKAVETDKGIEWHLFDPEAPVPLVPTGKMVGYKLTTDSVTGTRSSGADKTAPATDILTEEGGSVRDLRTGTEGVRTKVKADATQQSKNEQEVKVAESDVTHTDDMMGRWKDLYNKASGEKTLGVSHTGPVAGRAATAASKVGLDMGPATNEAATEMEREMQSYIVKMTGLSSTDQQYKRLMATAPHLGMDPKQFAARSKVWQDEVKRAAAKKKQVAGQKPAVQEAAAETPAPAPAGPDEVTRKTKDGRKAVFNAKTKEFIRWAD